MPGLKPRQPKPQPAAMDILCDARRLRNNSDTSISSKGSAEQLKKMTSKEQLPRIEPRLPHLEQAVMDILNKARRLRNNSNTSLGAKGNAEQLKKRSPMEPPKHEKRVTFSKPQMQVKLRHTTVKESESQTGLTSCLITNPTREPRMPGGANNPAERNVGWLARTDSECQFKAPGIDFLTERDTDVVTFEVKMRESVPIVQAYTKCDYFPTYVDRRRYKDQTTQTLYRESSAQTVAYLPDIMNRGDAENLEIFNLSTLLPGDKPPGLYEVEVLERARKRWEFKKALKTNFRKQLHEEREKAMKSKYRPILEAFEWEQWIEREEYIQECQMMRLELVIRMFDKREKEMHNSSNLAIEKACVYIDEKRQRELKKNEIEYQRALRRLQIKNSGVPRRWVKASPMYSLGSPCSEFYGPLIRHGVDPSRRNFVGDGRKAFDMRIDDLEKQVNMQKLQCPFTKLKEWSKPKEYIKEYEQNFCSDKNLQKLYESLKALRTQAIKPKTPPKCLYRRPKKSSENEFRLSYNYKEVDMRQYFMSRRVSDEQRGMHSIQPKSHLAIQHHMQHEERMANRPKLAKEMLNDRRREDLEHILQMYEGSTIGWIMQFLSEEMERLKEQRKLHFFSILAQKERWRREAAEAGLRQKENNMRLLYEDMFQNTNVVHNTVADEYINTILTTDMAHIAEHEAAETVTVMAKQIDSDIQRWLDSFQSVQTPLTYEPLRYMLREMVFPNLNERLVKYEKFLISRYIIEDVLFPRIWDELETYDIANTIANDLIDRLIDNDLYLFSTDSESDEPMRLGQCEAHALIRKLIRQAVPGRRWKTENERIVHENTNSLFDDIFEMITEKMNVQPPEMEPTMLRGDRSVHHIKSMDNIPSGMHDINDEPMKIRSSNELQQILGSKVLTLRKKIKVDKVTGSLTMTDLYMSDDKSEEVQPDKVINTERYEPAIKGVISQEENPQLLNIKSTLDFGSEDDLTMFRGATAPTISRVSSVLTNIGVEFEHLTTQTEHEDQLIGVLNDIVPSYAISEEVDEATFYEADDEGSSWNDTGSEWKVRMEEEDIETEEESEKQPEAEVEDQPTSVRSSEEKHVNRHTFLSVFSTIDDIENENTRGPSLSITTKLDTISKSVIN